MKRTVSSGAPHPIEAAGALPDVDKPLGIADALDRFGIPHGGKADAGVEAEDDDG